MRGFSSTLKKKKNTQPRAWLPINKVRQYLLFSKRIKTKISYIEHTTCFGTLCIHTVYVKVPPQCGKILKITTNTGPSHHSEASRQGLGLIVHARMCFSDVCTTTLPQTGSHKTGHGHCPYLSEVVQ